MVNSNNGGKTVSVSDMSALRPPKLVTSSTLQRAKESAFASKKIISARTGGGQYVVKMAISAPTGAARTLSQDEVKSLRATKRQVAGYVLGRFAPGKK